MVAEWMYGISSEIEIVTTIMKVDLLSQSFSLIYNLFVIQWFCH